MCYSQIKERLICAILFFNSGLGDILKFKDLNIKMLGFSI